jgi:hypothetical protein
VPPEWVFQDEGYSGAVLVRPGLEALRDLAAEGQIGAALVYAPDRLSRKYAYQVLLAEERWKQRSRSGHFSSDHQWSWPKSPPPPVPTGERTASVLPRDLPASVSESASRGSGERSALP